MAHVVTLTTHDRDRSFIEVGISFTGRLKGGFYFAPVLNFVRIQNVIPKLCMANRYQCLISRHQNQLD